MLALTTKSAALLLSNWKDDAAFARAFASATANGELDGRQAQSESALRALMLATIEKWQPQWRATLALASWIIGESYEKGAMRLGVSTPTFYRRRTDELGELCRRLNGILAVPLAERDVVGLNVPHDDVVDRVVSLISNQSPGPRRVAVLGPFGSGKTTIAMRLAQHATVREVFRDGIVAVEIPPDVDVRLGFCQAVFESLHEQFRAIGSVEAQLLNARHLLHDRRMIFIVDNVVHQDMWRCMQLLGDGCACVVTTALPDIALSVAQANVIELRPLTQAQVVHVFRSRISDQMIEKAGISPGEFWLGVEPMISGAYPWHAVLLAGRVREMLAAVPGSRVMQEVFALLLESVEPGALRTAEPADNVLQLLDLIGTEVRDALWIFRFMPAVPAAVARTVLEQHFAQFASGGRALRLLKDIEIVVDMGDSLCGLSPVLRLMASKAREPARSDVLAFVELLAAAAKSQPNLQTMMICALSAVVNCGSAHLATLLDYINREGSSARSWLVELTPLEDCIERVPEDCLLSFCFIAIPLFQARGRGYVVSRMFERLAGLKEFSDADERLAYGLLLEAHGPQSVHTSGNDAGEQLAARSFDNGTVRKSVVIAKLSELLNRMQVYPMRRLVDRFTPQGIEVKAPRDGTYIAATAQQWLHYLCGEPAAVIESRIEQLAGMAATKGYVGAENFGHASLGWITHFAGRYADSRKHVAGINLAKLQSTAPMMSHLIQNVECLNDLADGFLEDARERAKRALAGAAAQSQWLEYASLLLTMARIELDERNSDAALEHSRRSMSTAKGIRNKPFLVCAAGMSTAAVARAGGNPTLMVVEAETALDDVDPWSRLIWLVYSIERFIYSHARVDEMPKDIGAAISLAASLECPEFESRARFVQAQVLFSQQRIDQARDVAYAALSASQRIGHAFHKNIIAWLIETRLYQF